jgi:hypothetical protein
MEPVLGKANVARLIESIRRLESVPSIRQMTSLLSLG